MVEEAHARPASGIAASVTAQDLNVMEAVGGWRGIIESVLPTVVFLVIYVLNHQTMLAVMVALAVCAVFIIVRAASKAPVMPAFGGLLAMGISAVLAWRTGDATNVFLWGILTNVLYGSVILVSVLVRWPLLGVLISWVRGEGMGWRRALSKAVIRRRYYQITWLWVGLFSVRLAVELPLYCASATEALGIAKLALGLPLFALVVWFSWLIAQTLPPVQQMQEQTQDRE